MKKIFLILILILASCALLSWIGWGRRADIAAHLIQKHLGGVSVSIHALDLNDQGASINQLVIGNPKGFRSSSSFLAETIEVTATWKQLRADPLTIDRIEMSNLLITLEESSSGKTNWDRLLGSRSGSHSNRRWLLRSLILNNLTVRVMKADGSVKQYPTLQRMEFSNLSDETGFPVDEIEKAILNEMMRNLLQNLNLQNLLPPFPGKQYVPALPKLF